MSRFAGANAVAASAVLQGLLAALTGCSQPATEGAEAKQPDPPVPGPPRCRSSSAVDPLARFAGGSCGWELIDSGTSLVLNSLASDPPPASTGVAPEVCGQRTCSFEGHATETGPVVLVRVASAGSEMPGGAWLGWTQGEALAFVDLWEGAGPTIMGDQTELGPAHALAPHTCGERFALLAVPRTNAGMNVDPNPRLQERAGLYDVDGASLRRVGDVPSGCEPVPVPLP